MFKNIRIDKQVILGISIALIIYVLIDGFSLTLSFVVLNSDFKNPQPFYDFSYNFYLYFIRFFGVTQLIYIIPLIYFFRKNNKLVTGLRIGAVLVLLLYIVLILFFCFLDRSSKESRLINTVKSKDEKLWAFDYKEEYKENPILSQLGFIQYPLPITSYRVIVSGLGIDFQTVFEAGELIPLTGPEIKWKDSRTLEISYEKSKILKYQENLKLSKSSQPNDIVNIHLLPKH